MEGQRVLVVGLGRFGGGVGVSRWLAGEGARVTVTDHATPESLADSVAALADCDVTLRLGGHDLRDLDGVDLVVLNPAVHKARSELFHEITRRGLPWTTEINLFCERCPGRVIGITGSYGKSTTCAMLADALRACLTAEDRGDIGVHLGGNIGRSLLGDLPRIGGDDWVILELSNAQLDDLPQIHWTPAVAVITNLFPHHLDRYDSFDDYVMAKLNIVRSGTGACPLIIGEMHERAGALLPRLLPKPSELVRIETAATPVELHVPGEHNQRNATCVLTVCRVLGLRKDVVRDALRDFSGLPHRLAYVGTVDEVEYYNDSKSTSPAATLRAVECFDRPIVAIVGGQDRGVSLEGFGREMARRCRQVICLGEARRAFAEAIRMVGGGNALVEVDSLQAAVELAHKYAQPGDVVLFSPGAPSFDAFANYAERGRRFTECVRALSSASRSAR